ncbi:salicylate hydroxylase [Podospora didyma]|uniref:Salicylate hydroxylase n=1 Tax=Podospora didyma TaxID=330526 RepID=A0AAE0NGJ6_9PEZI|nr:salicylate hydroxylase [Podospora didyma]
MAKTKIRIAIIGGGLAGTAVPNALVRSGNLDGSGPEAGTIIIDLGGKGDPGVGVHRASLFREVLSSLPPDRLHASKKLTSITRQEAEDGAIQASLDDGTVEHFDAVIGADGIFSSVRNHVPDGADAALEEHSPSPAGFWDCTALVPFEKAKSRLGEQYFEVDRLYGWMGDGAFIMHDLLDARKTVQCVMSMVEKDPSPTPAKDRKRPVTRELLNKALHAWLDGPITNGVIDMNLMCYSRWEQKSTPTYASGRVCIVGDAAHATSPWQGAGAGQAFENAVVLGALLGGINITRATDLAAAFKEFDAVRRPRCQQVIDSSRGTGVIMCGREPDVGLDPDRMRAALAGHWSFIFSLDLDGHKADALERMKEFLLE